MTMAPERLARIEELLDRQDIEAALRRISRGIDRFDRDSFLLGYHPDAVIDAGAMVGDPASVFDMGAALHDDGQSGTQHHLTNHTCELDGDSAHCETYWLYVGRNRDGSIWAAGGRYIDRMERRAGDWRVAFRQTVSEWSGSFSGNEIPLFANIEDVHLNGAPSRGRDDPSYRRPFTNLRATRMPTDAHALSRPRD